MKCMKPHIIYYDKVEKKYSFTKPKKYDPDQSIFAPCGKCPACRAEWRVQLAQRIKYEMTKYNEDEMFFVTLTVNDENIKDVFPNYSLQHRYFQLFIKRLRRYLEYHKIPHKPIKYFMCGEYGEKGNVKTGIKRPHYHAIIFGWKPTGDDIKFTHISQSGIQCSISTLLEKLWSKSDATQQEIDNFNNNPNYRVPIAKRGGKLDYLPLGFVEIGNVTPRTAPYMVKYICKFSEIPQRKTVGYEYVEVKEKEYNKITKKWMTVPRIVKKPIVEEFTINGGPARKPYLVYPKKILGLDWFIENYKQILRNGYILDGRGRKHGIPKSFLKWCKERCTNADILEEYNYYLLKVYNLQEQDTYNLKSLGYLSDVSRWKYYREQGEIRRQMYMSFKNVNR